MGMTCGRSGVQTSPRFTLPSAETFPGNGNVDQLHKKQVVRDKRILVVDDETIVRKSTRMLLEIDGHAVAEAESGARGLELFAPDRFDLVITDFMMPGMTGAEFAAKLKRASPKTPVLMITAFMEDVLGNENPVDLVIEKPFTVAELRRAVAQLAGT